MIMHYIIKRDGRKDNFNRRKIERAVEKAFIEVDGKKVLVIRVARGQNRPYTIPIDVTAKQSNPAFYVRSGTSSIVAKGEVLDELRDMASRVPFVERGNPQIKLSDISRIHLKDYLVDLNYLLSVDFYNFFALVFYFLVFNFTLINCQKNAIIRYVLT